MPTSNSLTEDTNEKDNTPRVYNWLVYLELEKALSKFGAKKGYLSRISADAIDGEPVGLVESKIHAFKSLPFYKRIFAYLTSNISEFTSLHLFYKAKLILGRLTINTELNLAEWNKALDELKILDKEAHNHLPLFNFQYIYDSIMSWPLKAKNKQYIFNSVHHAFSNPANWKNDTKKVMNLRELQKVKSVNKVAKYLHKQAEDYFSVDNRDNVTTEQIDLHKWRLTEFNNAVTSYYKDESWAHQSAPRCKTTIEAISAYINDAITIITGLFPVATHHKCIAAFRKDNSRENYESLEKAAIAVRDQNPIQHDSLSAWRKFKDHEIESNLALHKESFEHIEESKEIENSDTQYRRLQA